MCTVAPYNASIGSRVPRPSMCVYESTVLTVAAFTLLITPTCFHHAFFFVAGRPLHDDGAVAVFSDDEDD